MVVDLDAWRREQVEEHALDYWHRYAAQVFFHEQEALNVVLARRARSPSPAGAIPPAALEGVATAAMFPAHRLERDVVSRVRAKHDLALHVRRLRERFEGVCGARIEAKSV